MKLSAAQLKYVRSLHLRKFRQKYHNFIVEGSKMASEVLTDGRLEVEAVYATPEWEPAIYGIREKWDSKTTIIAPEELKKISTLATPNQVLLVVKQPNYISDPISQASGLLLYLDNIRDPGNFGTILRIADWFGIEWVFCSENCVELFNPKTIHSTMGAFLRVKCTPLTFDKLMETLPGLPIFGATLDGASVFESGLACPAILIIGNESKGISSEILPFVHQKISIPKGKRGGAESLNAAVAAGILCAQFYRGR